MTDWLDGQKKFTDQLVNEHYRFLPKATSKGCDGIVPPNNQFRFKTGKFNLQVCIVCGKPGAMNSSPNLTLQVVLCCQKPVGDLPCPPGRFIDKYRGQSYFQATLEWIDQTRYCQTLTKSSSVSAL
jgi:hypothetical protein